MCEFDPPAAHREGVAGLVEGRCRRDEGRISVGERTCGGGANRENEKLGVMYLSGAFREERGRIRLRSGCLAFVTTFVFPAGAARGPGECSCRAFDIHDQFPPEGPAARLVVSLIPLDQG